MVTLGYKFWLEQGGKAFGDGPLELLDEVDRTGSLRQGAATLGMSYNKAWHLIRNLEARLGFPLLVRHAGGVSGGSSTLTAEGRDLATRYRQFRAEATESLEALFARYFSDA